MNRILDKLATGLHYSYKKMLSPFFGNACRFEPSCSDYALEALRKWGIMKGSALAIYRIIRCNPCCKGGEDPVPERRMMEELK